MPGLLIVPGRAGTTTSVATIRTIRGMRGFALVVAVVNQTDAIIPN